MRTYAVLAGYSPSLPSLLHIAWMCPLSLALHWRHNESDGFPGKSPASRLFTKQRVLMHGHQGWNVRHGLCHIYMRYVYIWVVYSLCFFCCLFITVTWWYVWCIEWASGNQEEVQACLVTLWLFIISCYSLYKTTLGLLCSWFENNPHFHKYSMDFHV